MGENGGKWGGNGGLYLSVAHQPHPTHSNCGCNGFATAASCPPTAFPTVAGRFDKCLPLCPVAAPSSNAGRGEGCVYSHCHSAWPCRVAWNHIGDRPYTAEPHTLALANLAQRLELRACSLGVLVPIQEPAVCVGVCVCACVRVRACVCVCAL